MSLTNEHVVRVIVTSELSTCLKGFYIQFNIDGFLTPLWNQDVDFTVFRVLSPSDGGDLLSLDLKSWFCVVELLFGLSFMEVFTLCTGLTLP